MARGLVLASAALADSVEQWTAICASFIGILLGAAQVMKLLRRNRRRTSTAPQSPALGATPAEWELYAHLLEQHLKDQEGSS